MAKKAASSPQAPIDESDLIPVVTDYKPKDGGWHTGASDYEVPKHEKHLVHAEIEKRIFDRVTGERKSKPYVQKWDPQQWETWKTQAESLGYTINCILHAPDMAKARTKPKKSEPVSEMEMLKKRLQELEDKQR